MNPRIVVQVGGIWMCKIGVHKPVRIPLAADAPMRSAAHRAYKEITGREPDFCFSGWSAELTEGELEVVLKKKGN